MNAKNILSIPFNGYKALWAMARGDMEEAYNLTHFDKKITKKKRIRTEKVETFNCPSCNKLLNERVKKCSCGLEFK